MRALRAVSVLVLPLAAPAGAQQVPVRDSIPGTLVTFEMVPVPGGSVSFEAWDGTRSETVAPFLIGRTEVTWDMYDVFMFGLDGDAATGEADAIARPSPPYAVPDYGWGRSGYAAISVTYQGARRFAEWLSAVTGHTYRLATEAEWVHATNLAFGEAPLAPEAVGKVAWHRGNAGERTHPVGSRDPDALGLFDLLGNVAEWVVTESPRPIARGGSFMDAATDLGPHRWEAQQDRWTERDPQLPRSAWWLTDGPFVGFRLVREP